MSGRISGSWKRPVPTWVAAVVVVVAVLLFVAVGVLRFLRARAPVAAEGPPQTPLRVPLFVAPESVVHRSRLLFTYDSPEVLAPLRAAEGLDAVVAEATSHEDAARRLMRWVRAQWEPGRPDPYPPPDARVILDEIRSRRTGGFCAQYCFVLVQAVQSFGVPARYVTIDRHEVVEVWLGDESRWVMLDPLYELQVVDAAERTLSALEIRRGVEQGDDLRLTVPHHYEEGDRDYVERYRRFAVWIRNDLVSRPVNFVDFRRYRVWFDPPPGQGAPEGALSTTLATDLYPQ